MSDIFYDLETKELLDLSLEDQAAAIRALHFSVGAAWCECHKEQIFYRPAALARHLLAHDRIIGFSIKHFDNPVLAYSAAGVAQESSNAHAKQQDALPAMPEELRAVLDGTSLDLQLDLEERVGYRLPLAALAAGTLRREKKGTAALAVIWYRLAAQLKQKYAYALREANDHEGADRAQELGAYFQERLEQYCAGDVQIARQVFEHGIKHRRVMFLDFDGERKIVKVDWRDY